MKIQVRTAGNRIVMILIAAVLLCACKQKEKEATGWNINSKSDAFWMLSDSVGIPEAADSRYILFRDETLIYMSRGESGYDLHIRDFSDENSAGNSEKVHRVKYPQENDMGEMYLVGVCRESSGADGFWGLWRRRSEGEETDSYELARYNMTGNLLDTVRLPDQVSVDPSGYQINAAAADGFLYFLAGEELTIITQDGRVVSAREVMQKSELLELGGSYYLAEAADHRTMLSRLADGVISENTYEIPIAGEMYYAGKDGLLYLSADSCLYRCDIENQTAELVLNWGDADLKFMDIRFIAGITDTSVDVCGYEGGEFVLWRLKPSDQADKRVRITLLGNKYSWQLEDWAKAFNQSNTEYRVVIKDPGISELDYDELTRKVQLMLTSSDAPDIVDLSSFDTWNEWAQNGAFADMTPFLAEGSAIREADYLPNIWGYGRVDGKQVFIPYSLTITLMFGQERHIGSGIGWTVGEFVETCNKHDDMPVFSYGDESSCLQTALMFGIEDFVDFSEGTCDFENQSFYEVLECAYKAGSRRFDPTSYEEAIPLFDRILDGKILLENVFVMNFGDYSAYNSDILSNSGESIKLALKGYPSKTGQPGGLGNLPDKLAICGNSKNKEGAWAFIEYVIEESWGDMYSTMITPAKTDRLRAFFAKKQDVRNSTYEKLGLESAEPTADEVEELMDIVGNLRFRTKRDEIIWQIIYEETKPYFDGGKSKEEAAEVIQNRVQLYLAEQGR